MKQTATAQTARTKGAPALLRLLLAAVLALGGLAGASPAWADEPAEEGGATQAAAPDAGEEGGDNAAAPDGDGTAAPAAADAAAGSSVTPAQIVLQAQEVGELTVTNQWTGPVVVSQGGKQDVTLQGNLSSTTLTVSADEQVVVRESDPGVTFRSWHYQGMRTGLVSGVPCAITSMPAMSAFTVDGAGTTAGDCFFCAFNNNGSLASFPAGSFDTSGITTAGRNFFSVFTDSRSSLTALPEGSFDISNITTVGNGFFSGFNESGSLASLPAGSFDTSNVTEAGGYFFSDFNYGGRLASLPADSFDISGITEAGDHFFSFFNCLGSLVALPAGSFDTSNVTTAEGSFFSQFNFHGSLASLPAGSFDTSGITTAGDWFFTSFNHFGSLASLPAGSFDISGVTTAGHHFLFVFNCASSIKSLPSSFRLPQAPASVGSDYCSSMFSSSPLVAGDRSVPLYFAAAAADAFKGTGIAPESPAAGTTVHVNGGPDYSPPPAVRTVAFDARGGSVSPLSVRVAHGAAIGTLPTPKRAGHDFQGWFTAASGGARVTAATPVTADVTWYAHWTAVACTVKFDANGGKVAGKASASVKRAYGSALGKLPTPTRTGYTFQGWYTGKAKGAKAGVGTKVAKDVTYYARWKAKAYTVRLDANGGKVGKAPTSFLKKSHNAKLGRLATPKRSGHTFLGWYTKKSGGTKVAAGTRVTKAVTLYAHWKRAR
jgi:uncharacterized repeat protein (TIGR02543 family)